MEKVITINNRDETLAFGEYLGKLLKPHMLLTLNGDLGAGKTTFTKGIGKGLGIILVLDGDAVDGNGRAISELGFYPVGVHVVAAGKQFVHGEPLSI